jgi:hypothetical protein
MPVSAAIYVEYSILLSRATAGFDDFFSTFYRGRKACKIRFIPARCSDLIAAIRRPEKLFSYYLSDYNQTQHGQYGDSNMMHEISPKARRAKTTCNSGGRMPSKPSQRQTNSCLTRSNDKDVFRRSASAEIVQLW